MANRSKTSVQGSRSLSPHTEEVTESPDDLLHSDHEEDLEVSFHPHHTPVPPANPVGPRTYWHVYALYQRPTNGLDSQ